MIGAAVGGSLGGIIIIAAIVFYILSRKRRQYDRPRPREMENLDRRSIYHYQKQNESPLLFTGTSTVGSSSRRNSARPTTGNNSEPGSPCSANFDLNTPFRYVPLTTSPPHMTTTNVTGSRMTTPTTTGSRMTPTTNVTGSRLTTPTTPGSRMTPTTNVTGSRLTTPRSPVQSHSRPLTADD